MLQIAFVVFLMLACKVDCYNIVVSSDEIRFVRPMSRHFQSYTSSPNVNPTSTTRTAIIAPDGRSIERTPSPIERNPPPLQRYPSLTPIEGNSFFGYDVSISSTGSGRSLTIGAPKTKYFKSDDSETSQKNYQATGNIVSCSIEDIFTNQNSSRCFSVLPPGARPGDAFGLSNAEDQDGSLRACSPTRKQDCTVAYYNPGYCFRRRGRTRYWVQDPLSRQADCPSSSTLDLIFVLDGSGSVGEENFLVIKNWVVEVAQSFNIRDDLTRVGVIQYSHFFDDIPTNEQPYFSTEIALGEYRNQTLLAEAIGNITLFGFTTYTAHALNRSVEDFMSSNRFDFTAKVLILLTDGRSTDSDFLATSAAYVRSLGINTIAVGVGDAQVAELRTIATGTTSDTNVFYVSQFEQLFELINILKSSIQSFVLEGSQRSGEAFNYFQFAQIGFSIRPSLGPRTNASAALVNILIV